MPAPSIVLNPSLSSANCESAAHREWHLVRSTRTGSQTISFLVDVIPSTDIHFSAGPQVKTSCPHSESSRTEDLSHVCFGLAQSSHQHAKLLHLLLKQSSMSMSAAMSTTAGTSQAWPLAQTRERMLGVHSKTKHPFRCVAAHQQIQSQDHQVLACLFTTRSPPTEHGRSHHQSSPPQHGARHAAVCGLAAVFRRAASHPRHQPVLPCRPLDHRGSFGNRFCRNHCRNRCRIRVSGDQFPRHTHELVKEFPQSLFLPVVSVSDFELARHQAQCQRRIPSSSQRPRGTIHRSNVPGDDLLSCQ